MFERYTERARRVLFFARDEARRTGGDAIEAGHLLLGLLREASGMSARAFARAHVSPDEVRKALEGRAIVRERRRADGDLQFSDETRRILELAAEEADRLLHNHIGTEHLLLGILRDPESLAGSILAERGMRVDAVRDDIVILTCERLMTPGARQRHPEFPPPGEAKVVPTQRTQHESVADDKGADYWAVEGASLKTMLSKLYGMQTTRIELPASLDDDRRYDFLVVLADDESRPVMNQRMQEAIEKHFRIGITHETRLTDVYVITAPSGTIAAKELRRDEPGSFGWMEFQTPVRVPGNFTGPTAFLVQEAVSPTEEALHAMGTDVFKGFIGGWKRGVASIRGMSAAATLEQLCETLEAALDRPVVDETNLTGAYELDVRTDAQTRDQFLHALCDRLGLAATPAKRHVAMLVARQT